MKSIINTMRRLLLRDKGPTTLELGNKERGSPLFTPLAEKPLGFEGMTVFPVGKGCEYVICYYNSESDLPAEKILSRFEKTAKNFGGMIKMAFIQRYLRLCSR